MLQPNESQSRHSAPTVVQDGQLLSPSGLLLYHDLEMALITNGNTRLPGVPHRRVHLYVVLRFHKSSHIRMSPWCPTNGPSRSLESRQSCHRQGSSRSFPACRWSQARTFRGTHQDLADHIQMKSTTTTRSARDNKRNCPLCSRSFAKTEHLERHVRSHTKEKPFECPQCGRKYGRKYVRKLMLVAQCLTLQRLTSEAHEKSTHYLRRE